jgi:Flp pilus assembly protein TadD
MNAHDGAGFAYLRSGDPAQAIERFERALQLFPEHARSLVGLGAAQAAHGNRDAAESAFTRSTAAIDGLRRGGRNSEAALSEAMLHAVRGKVDDACQSLNLLLERPDVPFSGWTIPIEPLLESLRRDSQFEQVRVRLADRAR